jgi:hypothetical protein
MNPALIAVAVMTATNLVAIGTYLQRIRELERDRDDHEDRLRVLEGRPKHKAAHVGN